MFLPHSRVADVARQMVQSLTADGDIETAVPREVQLDLEAVINEYLRTEGELMVRARETVESRGLSQKDYGRVLRTLADQKKVKIGEEALDYVLGQLLEMLLNSSNVEEVYAEDHVLRRKLREPLRKEGNTDEKLDKEVRSQLKHVQEGTSLWEVEYQRMMADIRRRRGV